MSNETTKRVEILLSAMNQSSFDIAIRSKVDSDLLIINQCDNDGYDEIEVNGHLWRMISTTERGLSKSRNMALKNAKGDICLFSDDDEEFFDNYSETLLRAYRELPDAAAVVFNIRRINNQYKKKYYRISKIRKAPMYRAYMSPMLSIRLDEIKKKKLNFNESFGSGTEWGGGEDTLFERDIRKCGLKMYEYPAEIATVDYSFGSQWHSGYNQKLYYNLGAFQHYYYKNNFFLKFIRRLYDCYKFRNEKQLNAFEKIRWMRLGEWGIKRGIPYSEYVNMKSNK